MFTLAVTDLRWHASHLSNPPSGPVNFWTPTLWKPKLEKGSKLFFMLKAPIRKLGGFGYVSEYREETVEDAWTLFGTGNGAPSAEHLRLRVDEYAEKRAVAARSQSDLIGCIVLDDAVFFGPEDQVDPAGLGVSFPNPIVKYKCFDGELEWPGQHSVELEQDEYQPVTSYDVASRQQMVALRPEQAAFRRLVLEAYGRRCAFLGTRAVEALDAAHIQPYCGLASNHVQNGIPLRKDLHALFDAGLLAVDEDYKILVSSSLAAHHPYGKLQGRPLKLPEKPSDWPAKAALAIHRATFRG